MSLGRLEFNREPVFDPTRVAAPEPDALRERLHDIFCRAGAGDSIEDYRLDELALAMVRVNFRLADIVRCYDEARAGAGSDRSVMERVRDAVLDHYNRVLSDYREARASWRQEITDRRVAEDRLRDTNSHLIEQRDQLRAEALMRARELAQKNEKLAALKYGLAHQRDDMKALIGAVSHDLKAPVRTAFELLRMFSEDQESSEPRSIALARSTLHRMSGQLEGLVDFSQSMQPSLKAEAVDLADVVRTVVVDLLGADSQSVADIEIAALPIIHGSRSQLRLLFKNLVANALKYRHPDRRPKITVKHRFAAGSNGVLVAVKDNGIGIDARYYDTIFAVFERLHGVDEFPGSGIGLATCKRVASNHGGSIRVDSVPGEGSTFEVTLKQ